MWKVIFLVLFGLAAAGSFFGKEPPSMGSANHEEVITLGGGCFWCLEAVFQEVRGVRQVVSGYSGGTVANPTYQDVCSGETGHAEVVQVTFDPTVISLKEILSIFFTVHDPTTLNRQGADRGTQYRSIVLYRNEAQKAAVEAVIREIEAAKIYNSPVVTQVVPFEAFYKAESYHQDYYRNHPSQAYCRIVISPKVAKFREKFSGLMKKP